jgi:hypothetical protein
MGAIWLMSYVIGLSSLKSRFNLRQVQVGYVAHKWLWGVFSLNVSVFTWLYLSTSAQYSFQILPTIHCSQISLILTQGPSFLQSQLNLDTYHLTLNNSLLSSSFMLYFCSFCCCNLTGYFHISPHLKIKNKCVSIWTRQNLISLHSHQDIHDEGKKTVLPLHAMKAFGIVEVVRSTYS